MLLAGHGDYGQAVSSCGIWEWHFNFALHTAIHISLTLLFYSFTLSNRCSSPCCLLRLFNSFKNKKSCLEVCLSLCQTVNVNCTVGCLKIKTRFVEIDAAGCFPRGRMNRAMNKYFFFQTVVYSRSLLEFRLSDDR